MILIGAFGDLITEVLGKIQGFSVECNGQYKGLKGFLKKQKDKVKVLQAQYATVEKNLNIIVSSLAKKKEELKRVDSDFDAMRQENLRNYEFLTMIIYAGELAIEQKKAELARMEEEANKANDSMELNRVEEFRKAIERFEDKLLNLRKTRAIAINQEPQIMHIKDSAIKVSESIQTIIDNTIPIWKSSIAIAIGMETINRSLDIVNAVNDATNKLLIENSKMNKELTIKATKAAQRGVVDIETLNQINQDAIETLLAKQQLAKEAKEKREMEKKQLEENERNLQETIKKQLKTV